MHRFLLSTNLSYIPTAYESILAHVPNVERLLH